MNCTLDRRFFTSKSNFIFQENKLKIKHLYNEVIIMTTEITVKSITQATNHDKNGNPFNVYYIGNVDGQVYTMYDNTPGKEFVKENESLFVYYNKNTKNGKTYNNLVSVERLKNHSLLEIEIEKALSNKPSTLDTNNDPLVLLLITLIKGVRNIADALTIQKPEPTNNVASNTTTTISQTGSCVVPNPEYAKPGELPF